MFGDKESEDDDAESPAKNGNEENLTTEQKMRQILNERR
jgi:hypothetical protein